MKAFELSIAVPRGGLLIGGYSAVPPGLNAVHASDAGGRPIIPSSAVRGALRESLEALLRGTGQQACSGGNGLLPGEPAQTEANGDGCGLRDGGLCRACELFGTQRAAIGEGERASSALRLGDAVLDGSQSPWRRQPGVALDRRRRGASDKRLFDRRVAAAAGHRFVATGDLTSAEEEAHMKLLEAAASATTHIGSGRSRGMARVDLSIAWQEPEREAAPEIAGESVFVRATLLSPATFSLPQSNDNVRETREEVPGSALRGAVGWALARKLERPDEDEAFQALVAEDGARFGFLYPVDAGVGRRGMPAAPWPITAQTCKLEPEHGPVDTLLDAIAVQSIRSPDEVAAVEQAALDACSCGQPLTRARGSRRRSAPLPKRMVTRVSLDRRRSSALDGALFAHVLIEPGAAFEGRIAGIPTASRGRLAEALAERVFLGRGSSMGWGRVSLELVEPPNLDPLELRAERFEDALRARLSESGLPTGEAARIVPVTLMSPLVPMGSDPDGSRTLLEGMGCEAEWALTLRRFVQEGGWDQRLGKMTPCLAVAAGGVFVARLVARDWRDCLGDLARLERRGAGARRHQGYGEALCFDPFILHRSFQDGPSTDS